MVTEPKMLTEDQITSLIKAAFLPLHCEIKFNTYDGVIAIGIFGPNHEPIAEVPRFIAIDKAQNEAFLKATLSLVRSDIEGKGYSLVSWPNIDK